MQLVIEGSAGPVVLFVHGWACSPRYWRETMVALAPDYRSLAPDLFGGPDPLPGKKTLPEIADSLAALLERLGIRRAHVVGHSMGGVIAQLLALRHPRRVARLVLTATGAHVRGHGIAHDLPDIVPQAAGDPGRMGEILRRFFFRPPPSDLFAALAADAARARAEDLALTLRSFLATDLAPELRRIRASTLVIHGERDTLRTLEHARGLEHGIRGSRLEILDASGHCPMLEEPARYQRLVREFLSAPGSRVTKM